jgi:16S rRNA (cytosine1402-N4)-methyltransferase
MSAAPAAPGHVPVLLKEAMEALDPREGGVDVDGTFGAGGYTRSLLDRGARVIALDRDPSAIRAGEKLKTSSGGRLELVEARFGELDEVVKRFGRRGGWGQLDIGFRRCSSTRRRAASLQSMRLLICAWQAARLGR